MKKKTPKKHLGNWERGILHLFVAAPFTINLLLFAFNFLSESNIQSNGVFDAALIMVAIFTYWLLSKNEKAIYPKGDLPLYNSMFFAGLLTFPLIALYDPTPEAVYTFALLDGAIIVAISIFVIVMTNLKPEDLPATDSFAAFLLVVTSIICLTILAMSIFAFRKYVWVGFFFNYWSMFGTFWISIYMIQVFARKDKIDLKVFLHN